MTRKDYIALATVFAATLESYPRSGGCIETERTYGAREALRFAATRLASVLQADNDRFDRAKFMAACGVTV